MQFCIFVDSNLMNCSPVESGFNDGNQR